MKHNITKRAMISLRAGVLRMKAKLLTSILFGLCAPLLYAQLVLNQPLRMINRDTGETTYGNSGILGFIEFHGYYEAATIYVQALLVCATVGFIMCSTYDFLRFKLSENP